MTGGGRIWRRYFKIASKMVKYSPKCRGIRRIKVAIKRVCSSATVHRFTKVADFLMSSQFLAPLAPVIDSGG
jgi:hypothetical protein